MLCLSYYSSIVLDSFSVLLFPKLYWHIGLTPKYYILPNDITVRLDNIVVQEVVLKNSDPTNCLLYYK